MSNFRVIRKFPPPRVFRNKTTSLSVVALTLMASVAFSQARAKKAPARSGLQAEQRAARALEAARNNTGKFYAFLWRMPKGSDLHSHLSGAVYAETFIRDASEDGLCVDQQSLSFAKPIGATCGEGKVAAAHAYADQHLYDELIDAFSMRGFVPSPGITGHDHFFDTFGKFGGTNPTHLGEWLDEVATRAANQNEQYLELMHTPPFAHAIAAAGQVKWDDDFGKMRDTLLAHGLRDDVDADRSSIEQAEASRRDREHCGQPGELG
jgi:adenosine deaminase